MNKHERLKLQDKEREAFWDSMEGKRYILTKNEPGCAEIADAETGEFSGRIGVQMNGPVGSVWKPIRNTMFMERLE